MNTQSTMEKLLPYYKQEVLNRQCYIKWTVASGRNTGRCQQTADLLT